MRIALTFPACHRRGGIERVVMECANFLDGRGHEVHLVVSEWDAQSLGHGVHVHAVGPGRGPAPLRRLGFAARSRAALHRLHPAPQVLGTFGVVCPPGGVMWVPSVHKAWLRVSRSRRALAGRLKQAANPYHGAILRRERFHYAGRRYRKLIALTSQVKADLMSLYGVPESDIVIVPNGYCPDEFNPSRCAEARPAMRRQLGYGDGQTVIIFAANELARKGFGPLLQAVAAMNRPDLRILVVGRVVPGSYAAQIDRLGLARQVHFAGATADVASFYAAADVLALPTEYEAWGLVIVEALACGLPVLTSRLAGAAVVVREGRTGLLLDEPRNVEEIAVKLGQLLALAGGDRAVISRSVADYTWSRVLPQYESLLAGCADGD